MVDQINHHHHYHHRHHYLEIQGGGPRWPPFRTDDVISTLCDVINSLHGPQFQTGGNRDMVQVKL